MVKKKEKNGKNERRVSPKKASRAKYKWLKVVWYKLDELEERMDIIEKFLGGRDSMKRVLENPNPYIEENKSISKEESKNAKEKR